MAPRTRSRKPPFVGELVAKTFDVWGQELGIYQSAFPFIEPDKADEASPKCAAKRSAPPAGVVGRGTPSPGVRDRAEGLRFQFSAAVCRVEAREALAAGTKTFPARAAGKRARSPGGAKHGAISKNSWFCIRIWTTCSDRLIKRQTWTIPARSTWPPGY